jgi:hypothetical protein
MYFLNFVFGGSVGGLQPDSPPPLWGLPPWWDRLYNYRSGNGRISYNIQEMSQSSGYPLLRIRDIHGFKYGPETGYCPRGCLQLFTENWGGGGGRGQYTELDQDLSLSLFHTVSNSIFSKCRALRHFVYCRSTPVTTVAMETTVWRVMQCTWFNVCAETTYY